MRSFTLFAALFLMGCPTPDTGRPKPDDTGPALVDADGDGVTEDVDCDDGDPAVYPGADETCNGMDDDCDGYVDEDDAVDAGTWYADADGDGYGDAGTTSVACDAPAGTVEDDGDCDDADPRVHPEADEHCNGVDDDCDGTVDEDDAIDAATWYADADADGYGDASVSVTTCGQGDGWVEDDSDCDDSDPEVNPSADERCNGVDDDCDGAVDEDDAVDASAVYPDADGDGYGDAEAKGIACCACPSGYVTDSSDCDDADASIHPGADERCDGVDDDCDGTVDEDDAIDATTWYADADSDGYGDASVSLTTCLAASGWVLDDTDCDDSDASVHPGADEHCDGVDDDCDGVVDEEDALDTIDQYEDIDGDGFGGALAGSWCALASGYVLDHSDCDDRDATVYPGADEHCDGTDDDCNGTVDDDYAIDATTWHADADSDGYGDASVSVTTCLAASGWVLDDTDCDDSDAAVHPGADEYCNGVDDDCDGIVDEDDAVDTRTVYEDGDGDGFGDMDDPGLPCCGCPSGYVSDHSDCDDADASIHPGADEYCDAVDSDCDGLSDDGDEVDAATWYADGDLDGYGDALETTTACSEPSGYCDDSSDCDDDDPDVNPAASEACNGIDDDCDGSVDEDSAVAGEAAGCAAESCAAILAARPGATDGGYWIELPGAGTALELLCEMDVDGGGWTQAHQDWLAELSTGVSREYLYSKDGAWYLSPTTELIWDWSSYQVVEGTYYYSTGSDWAEGSFACSHAESGHYGIGCSNGGGRQWKVLPWGSGQDGEAATGPICQDRPDVFGAGACASGVSIWVR
jgi:hypothetical protein